MILYEVVLSKKAERDLKKVPRYIGEKLIAWIDLIKYEGIARARQIPGYYDQALKGDRIGQRSIRLSKGYRAIYIINENQEVF